MTILAVEPHHAICSSCALAFGHLPMHPIGWVTTEECVVCHQVRPCAPGEDYRPGSPEEVSKAIRERMGASAVQGKNPAPEPTSAQQSALERAP